MGSKPFFIIWYWALLNIRVKIPAFALGPWSSRPTQQARDSSRDSEGRGVRHLASSAFTGPHILPPPSALPPSLSLPPSPPLPFSLSLSAVFPAAARPTSFSSPAASPPPPPRARAAGERPPYTYPRCGRAPLISSPDRALLPLYPLWALLGAHSPRRRRAGSEPGGVGESTRRALVPSASVSVESNWRYPSPLLS